LRLKALNRKDRKEKPQRSQRTLLAAATRVFPKAEAVENSTQL